MRSRFTYVYVRILNTRQWTSLRVLSTPYVYVGRKKRSTGNQPLQMLNYYSRGPWKSWNYPVNYAIELISQLTMLLNWFSIKVLLADDGLTFIQKCYIDDAPP